MLTAVFCYTAESPELTHTKSDRVNPSSDGSELKGWDCSQQHSGRGGGECRSGQGAEECPEPLQTARVRPEAGGTEPSASLPVSATRAPVPPDRRSPCGTPGWQKSCLSLCVGAGDGIPAPVGSDWVPLVPLAPCSRLRPLLRGRAPSPVLASSFSAFLLSSHAGSGPSSLQSLSPFS